MSDYFEQRDKRMQEAAEEHGLSFTKSVHLAEAAGDLMDVLDKCSDPADIARGIDELRDFVNKKYEPSYFDWICQAVVLGLDAGERDPQKLRDVIDFCGEFQGEIVRWNFYSLEERRSNVLPPLRKYLRKIGASKEQIEAIVQQASDDCTITDEGLV